MRTIRGNLLAGRGAARADPGRPAPTLKVETEESHPCCILSAWTVAPTRNFFGRYAWFRCRSLPGLANRPC